MQNQIAFLGVLKRIATSADGWDVTFTVSQQDVDEIKKLSEHRDEVLSVGVISRNEKAETHNEEIEI